MLEHRIIDIDGVPVRYASTGRGKPLLLIHGLAGSWRWWQRNIAVLREHYTLYLIDLPGFGSIRSHGRRFALQRAPEWVRSLIHALELDRPVLIGHSMGGAIALAFAARWPEEIDGAILAAPAVDLPHKNVLSSLVSLLTAAGRVQLRFYPTLVWDAMRTGPVMVLRTARTLISMDLTADLRQVRTPILLIWGRRDVLVPVTIGQMLRNAVPTSTLLVIENAGHVVMFDQPAEFNATVLRFLSGEVVGE